MRQSEFERIIETNHHVRALWHKTILITGVTGTIGAYLFEFLQYCNVEYNAEVMIICPVRRESAIRDAWKKYPQTLWTDYSQIDKLDVSVDYVVHCACPTRSKEFVEKPVETIEAIVFGTKRLLDFFKRCGCLGFLYISSIEIYGDNFDSKKCFCESTIGAVDTMNIRSSYPEAKRMTENLCVAYADEYKLPIKIVRLAQILGAGDNDNRLIAYLCKSAMDKRQIILHSDGKATKSYCYIMDCISAMLYVLVAGDATAYNVANPDLCASVYDLAKLVSDKYIGLSVVMENKVGNIYPASGYLVLDSNKLGKLGWKAYVGLEDAIDRLIIQEKEKNK